MLNQGAFDCSATLIIGAMDLCSASVQLVLLYQSLFISGCSCSSFKCYL
jgi:hypothetical protein